MGSPHDNSVPAAAHDPPSGPRGEVVFVLCTDDPALIDVWRQVDAPTGFCLQTEPALRPEHLAAGEPTFVLVDARAASETDGPLADLLYQNADRCIWTGPAEAIERLGLPRIREAYDILVTPTSPATLGRRLAGWARNIQRTAALESLGRRVEQLAERCSLLSARLAESEAGASALAEQRSRLDRALHRIHQVARLSREINSLDLDRIVSVCVERLPALIEAKRASLYLYDAAADRLVLQGHSHDRDIAKRVDLQENPRSPMAVAMRQGELLLIGEFGQFEREADITVERDYKDLYSTGSCIIVPLKGGGRVRGVLNLADKEHGGSFDMEIDLPVIEQIAELIGASIYNVELFQEMEHRAKSDPLTGLANRRGAEEALARETERSRRYGSRLSVMMFDVDQLKAVNDAYGHEAGDAVLQNLAAILLETIRSVDVPGRWAGDEFIVVLPDTPAEQAKRLAGRLLERVHEQPAVVGDRKVAASLSIGVADYRKDEAAQSLVRRVDQAMYAAKAAGRDRIATADPDA